MDKDQRDQRKFLEQQLQWYKEQAHILDEINVKLQEMKEITEYALENELITDEIEELNEQLNELKRVVLSLEQQVYSGVVH